MRRLPVLALSLSLLTLAACEDSTGNGGDVLRFTGVLDANGEASVNLPREAGTPDDPPALTCYTADPLVPASERVWFHVSSVQLPADLGGEVVSNCLLEPSFENPNRLMATLEGEEPGWLYAFVVVY
ncbi:MAG TPA: hypothetical protein VGE02_09760 [Gemmatimonadales bacterium]